jgi:hypothetical protein
MPATSKRFPATVVTPVKEQEVLAAAIVSLLERTSSGAPRLER